MACSRGSRWCGPSTISATRPKPRSKSWCGPTRRARASRRRWSARASYRRLLLARGGAQQAEDNVHGRHKWVPSSSASASPGRSRWAVARSRAYFEAHIEQGPILEAAEKPIGIVQGAQGQRWYEITVTGQEAHAGPTPMRRRKDALVGASRMIDAVNRIGHAHPPYACATVGFIQSSPNSRNTIPGRVFFTVDFRHPDDATLTEMDHELREACRDAARASQGRGRGQGILVFPADAVRQELRRRGAAGRGRAGLSEHGHHHRGPATTPSTWPRSRRPQ